MIYLIILFSLLVIAGFAISLHMFFQDRRRKQRMMAGTRTTAQDIPSYQLSSWIDDEVAKRKLYRHPGLSASRLADELGLSERGLRHAIDRSYNKTVDEYLDDRRIQAACRLLREQPDMTIDDICRETGFTSRNGFLNLFTSSMGLTPEKYRTQMTKKV